LESEILIIEDDSAIRRLLTIALEASGFSVRHAANAREGKAAVAMYLPALILLDLGLPDQDGQMLLKDIREWYFKPLIIISARDAESEIIKALDHGANDYITKPFRTAELLARIRVALRQNIKSVSEPLINFDGLEIDFGARIVKKHQLMVKLTATEYALLSLFVKNAGKVLTHQFILREVWGPGYTERTEYPRVFVGQLRKKIEDDSNAPKYIHTESGVGYRFQV
jgi:two-component system, OmpR family, KDP operon response regulator KdpE